MSDGRRAESGLPSKIEMDAMQRLKIIIEKHSDGYVAYPVGINGVIVGQGDTYKQALADVQSAIRFHLDTFGADSLTNEEPVMEAFVAEAIV